VIGDVAGVLALVKGIPLGYNRDLQENTTPLYHAGDSLLGSLGILSAMMPEIEFDTVRTESAISGFAYATDLADLLVDGGMPFREAHAVVGKIVSYCLDRGRDLTDLTLEELQAAAPSVRELPEWTAAASVRRKRTSGSTHPQAVADGLQSMQASITEHRAWLEAQL
jgi:argininosuccinate lyase